MLHFLFGWHIKNVPINLLFQFKIPNALHLVLLDKLESYNSKEKVLSSICFLVYWQIRNICSDIITNLHKDLRTNDIFHISYLSNIHFVVATLMKKSLLDRITTLTLFWKIIVIFGTIFTSQCHSFCFYTQGSEHPIPF